MESHIKLDTDLKNYLGLCQVQLYQTYMATHLTLEVEEPSLPFFAEYDWPLRSEDGSSQLPPQPRQLQQLIHEQLLLMQTKALEVSQYYRDYRK